MTSKTTRGSKQIEISDANLRYAIYQFLQHMKLEDPDFWPTEVRRVKGTWKVTLES
jgi:hypothetical protein